MTQPPSRPPSLPVRYLPGIDGLRALAVIAVVLYHGGAGWLPGGFLGVEVFFVLSGFLITRMLLPGPARARGGLGLFWARRARRLLPAAAALLACLTFWTALFEGRELASLRADVAAACVYVTNWALIFRDESYFEAIGRPPLLKHLWSLAVEEQFYLLWPPIVLVTARFWGERGIAVVAALGAVASATLMALLFSPDHDPSRIYYGTDTRAAGVLLGAALAACWRPGGFAIISPKRACLALDGVGLGALAILAWSFVARHEFDAGLYRGGFAMVDLATAALIVVCGASSPSLLARGLSLAPLRWLGQRSYSLYLWHWPIFLLTGPYSGLGLEGAGLWALRLGLSFVFAEASYRLVETPIRRGALGRGWRTLRSRPLSAPEAGLGRRLRASRARAAGLSAAMVAATATGALAVALVQARPPAVPDYLQTPAVHLVFSGGERQDPPSVSRSRAEPSEVEIPDGVLGAEGEETARPAAAAAAVAHTGAGSELGFPGLEAWADTPTLEVVPAPAPAPEPTREPPSSPPPRPAPRAGVRVTAVGDSVMLGAAFVLGDALGDVEIDAAISRQAQDGVALIEALAAGGFLGSVLLVHLGTNGPLSAGQLEAIMTAAGERRVVFVNVRVQRPWEAHVNSVLADGVARHKNATLVDWHAASEGHDDWFRDDGVHLRAAGQEAYATLIADAVNR